MTIVGHQLKRERIRSLARRTRPPSLNGPRFDRASGNAFASPYQSDRRKREAGPFGLSGRFAARLIWIRSAHKRQSRSGERVLESTRVKSHLITASYRVSENPGVRIPISFIDRAIPSKPIHTPKTTNTHSTGGRPTALQSFSKSVSPCRSRHHWPFLVGGRYGYITAL